MKSSTSVYILIGMLLHVTADIIRCYNDLKNLSCFKFVRPLGKSEIFYIQLSRVKLKEAIYIQVLCKGGVQTFHLEPERVGKGIIETD